MRKIIAAILSALCFACLAFAFGCGEPSYYILTIQSVDGVTYNFYGYEDGEKVQLTNGYQVKEGSTVYFTYSMDDDVIGEAVVKANDTDELQPDAEGVYSFKMNGDTTIAVTGVVKQPTCEISFVKGDNRITYYVDGKEVEENLSVKAGDSVEFTLGVSVYYGDSDYTVLANTMIVNPTDGVYKFTATQDTNITVENLELDSTFLDRGAGAGTKARPYEISRPIDLYLLADRVNDDFWNGSFAASYYILTNDIDMQGEQLYIIGDGTTTSAYFYGDFNGNGKTISNFYIDDSIIEQSAYTDVFVPYIGLFGQVMANTARSPRIYDLNLSDFEIEVDAAQSKSIFYAGGLVGIAVGAEITNCTVSGTITARADVNYFGFIGGVVGYLQSAYSSDALRYYSSVSGCTSNVNISGNSGYIHSAGGIAGYVMSYEEKTAAYVINCVSKGNIVGAFYTGGVVGTLASYSSLKNCYSAGEYVEAVSRVGVINGDTTYSYAYGGGVVGYADYDSVVSGCFSTADVSASATAGSAYKFTGKIVGGTSKGGSSNIESSAALVINNYEGTGVPSADVLKNTLGWKDSDWSFEGNYPAPKKVADDRQVSVSIKNATSGNTTTFTLDDYLPISAWYSQDNGFTQFVSDGTNRSYGYYFTADGSTLSGKVPYSYILTGGETLNFVMVDYSAVAGEYYANYTNTNYPATSVDVDNVVLILGTDGSLVYCEGANQYTSYYIYDGTSITLYNCPALFESEDDSQTFTCGVATLSGGVLTISNNITYKGATALKAVKKLDNFVYGKYVASNNDVYYFNANGTGTINGNNSFTYVATNSTITATINNAARVGNVDANGKITSLGNLTLTAYDIFEGVWEKSATTHKQYTFDGLGNWSYKYFGYKDGKEDVISGDKGTYTYNSADETITLSDGKVAGFDKDGFLVVKDGEFAQTYYQQLSVAGTWRFAYRREAIQITFGGIGIDGYGIAQVDYESLTQPIEMTYDVRTSDGTSYIYLFYQNSVYGVLTYLTSNSTLAGYIYSVGTSTEVTNAVFCLYDDYKGNWIGDEWTSVEFNGFGGYSLAGSSTPLAVSGTVKINGINYVYTLNNSTMEGSIKAGEITYTISYDEVSGNVVVKNGDNTFVLTRYDAWRSVKLEDEQGNSYTFSGGGKLENGGKLTIGTTDYNYKVEDDKAVVYSSGDKVGEIAIVNNDYVYTLTEGGSKTLTITNDFTGSWAVSGAPDQLLVIGKIGANNTTSGTYLGENVTLTYNADSGYLSFVYNNRTIYVMSMNAKGNTELALAYVNNTLYGFTCCVATNNLDGYQGTYTLNGSTITLDGLGNSFYGKGSAVVYDAASGVKETMTYTINAFGMPMITGGLYLLKPVASATEGAYVKGDSALLVVSCDILYNVTATDTNGVKYIFNGAGEVTCGNDTYTYTIVENNTLDLVVTVRITKGTSVVDGKLDYSTTDYKITF